jgi:hypothetical protein
VLGAQGPTGAGYAQAQGTVGAQGTLGTQGTLGAQGTRGTQGTSGSTAFATGDTQTTVGSAGAASALPATPTGYLKVVINSVQYVIPYYPQA